MVVNKKRALNQNKKWMEMCREAGTCDKAGILIDQAAAKCCREADDQCNVYGNKCFSVPMQIHGRRYVLAVDRLCTSCGGQRFQRSFGPRWTILSGG